MASLKYASINDIFKTAFYLAYRWNKPFKCIKCIITSKNFNQKSTFVNFVEFHQNSTFVNFVEFHQNSAVVKL